MDKMVNNNHIIQPSSIQHFITPKNTFYLLRIFNIIDYHCEYTKVIVFLTIYCNFVKNFSMNFISPKNHIGCLQTSLSVPPVSSLMIQKNT